MTWQDHANCRGVATALFFPDKGETTNARNAKQVCAACSVRAECLDYALENDIAHGVWGGESERARRRLRAARNARLRLVVGGARGPVRDPNRLRSRYRSYSDAEALQDLPVILDHAHAVLDMCGVPRRGGAA